MNVRKDTQEEGVTMNLYYSGVGDAALDFVREMESGGTADLIRQEEGNLRYEYFISLADSSTVLLIDSWENQEALDRHHASGMMETITRLREKYDLRMRVERYRDAMDGMPAGDGDFLRR